jgi:hypothetical protein
MPVAGLIVNERQMRVMQSCQSHVAPVTDHFVCGYPLTQTWHCGAGNASNYGKPGGPESARFPPVSSVGRKAEKRDLAQLLPMGFLRPLYLPLLSIRNVR